MGFPMGKPVHSRAGEAPPSKSTKTRGGAVAVTDQEQGSTARRQEVKSKSGNGILAKDAKSKVKAAAEPKGKPATKSAKSAKPPAKPAKAAAKPVKVVAKPAKVAVKPVKAVAKPVKVAAKPVKVVAKPAAKVAVKAAAKPAAKKVAAKVVPVRSPKPAAKTSAKASAPVAKPVAKVEKSTKNPVTKPTPKPAAKPAPVVAAPKTKKPVQESQPVAKAAPAPVPPATAAVVAKAGRPSSRLAQLTVPSMAQAVASTAAKASYTQTMPTSVIVPVLPSSIKKDAKLANNWKTTPVAQLTDAELMAMPDAEYMNDVQMAAFRLKLTNLKRDILSNAGETTEHLREDTSVVPDPADRATIEEEHALELRTRDRERKLLKKIEQSIARIDAGDYGYCDETGEPIGVGRLLARPTATLSLEAQQRRELKQKMFGD